MTHDLPVVALNQPSQPEHMPVNTLQLAKDAFDLEYYAEKYPDVVGESVDLFDHFMTKGWTEGRNPSVDFNTLFYLARYPDVKEAGINPFVHWLAVGREEGRQANSDDDLAFQAFDADYYAENNPDLVSESIDLFAHYMTQGWKEGRNPNAEFNTEFYLKTYADIREAGINPFFHWLVSGKKEGRRPTPMDPSDLKSMFKISSDLELSADLRQRLQSLGAWLLSEERSALVDEAIAIDPEIGEFALEMPTLYPPLYDRDYFFVQKALNQLCETSYECVILVPFGKLGGADRIAGILSKSLQRFRSTLIIRTDSSEWERPEWYGGDILSVDFSSLFKEVHSKTRALYSILSVLNPSDIFNVNSRLGFEMFKEFGQQLAASHRLHCYYFCSDLDRLGNERGYPVDFFRQILPCLATAMIDSGYLKKKLIDRYSLPADQRLKLHLFYSPSSVNDQHYSIMPVVEEQISTQHLRSRPRILWAGRLDRQKRFDLVIEIAARMSHVDFLIWGKAVLDEPPDMSELPPNIVMNSPFTDYHELPLLNADGWLYTSSWDGIPTILIDIGSLGMPIIASAVGGIPEILSNDTGWLVTDIDNPESYVTQLNAMLSNMEDRRLRATRLRDVIKSQHSLDDYEGHIQQLLSPSDPMS